MRMPAPSRRTAVTPYRPPDEPADSLDRAELRENILAGDFDEPTPPDHLSSGVSDRDTMSQVIGLPFRFNPPLHKLSRSVRVDYGSLNADDMRQSLERWYEEYRTDNLFAGGDSDRNTSVIPKFRNLRLGRITMGDEAQNFTDVVSRGERFGFRFLYNPEKWSGGQSMRRDIVIDPGQTATYFLQTGMEQISMELLLNRIPDVNLPRVTGSDYGTNMLHPDDIDGLRKRGTAYDLEFLFRCANGMMVTKEFGEGTGDYGILLPNIVVITLGKIQFRARVNQITANHMIFSKDMVPTLTRVTLGLSRIVSLQPDQVEEYQQSGGRSSGRVGPDGYQEDSSGTAGIPDYIEDENIGTLGDLNEKQSQIAKYICDVAYSNFTGDDRYAAAVIGLITALVESEMRNLNYGDRDSQGVFQQRPSQDWGTVADVRDLQKSTATFFGLRPLDHTNNPGLKQIDGWQSLPYGTAADSVQRSAFPGRYQGRVLEAAEILYDYQKLTGET